MYHDMSVIRHRDGSETHPPDEETVTLFVRPGAHYGALGDVVAKAGDAVKIHQRELASAATRTVLWTAEEREIFMAAAARKETVAAAPPPSGIRAVIEAGLARLANLAKPTPPPPPPAPAPEK